MKKSSNFTAKLTGLRNLMAEQKLDAYIIPTADPHQSEYVPDRWAHRIWITGFTGSAGTAIVTHKHAGLWTDARYFLQAEQELEGSGFELHRLKVQTQAEYLDWLCQHLQPGQVVACDFWCFSYAQLRMFDQTLSAHQLVLKDSGDLMDSLWDDRPGLPLGPVYEHLPKFAGAKREEKLKRLRNGLNWKKTDYLILSALDEIAYLLNLRGSDVRCNPVFLAYLVVSKDRAVLFISPEKLNPSIKQKLMDAGVELMDYQKMESFLKELNPEARLQFDPTSLNAKLALRFQPKSMVEDSSPVMWMKAIKNEKERQHIRNAMEKDGVALVKSFMWLEKTLKKGKTPMESEFAQYIALSRSQQSHYVGESFDAIIGYNANGAIIHYKPDAQSSAKIKSKGILLVDCGGQYLDGTTDITRTIALGKTNRAYKQQYTAVLLGHIALAQVKFPEGTKGIQLDAFSRQYLWNLGLNFGHGTGHGVGYFMNVHEPPQGFVSAWNQRGQTPMQEGMLTSNEPGYYQEGHYGIRIENLVLNVLDSRQQDQRFLRFETVSLFPIETTHLDHSMMHKSAVIWLNDYHREVYKRLSPHLDATEKKWLKAKCKAI